MKTNQNDYYHVHDHVINMIGNMLRSIFIVHNMSKLAMSLRAHEHANLRV